MRRTIPVALIALGLTLGLTACDNKTSTEAQIGANEAQKAAAVSMWNQVSGRVADYLVAHPVQAPTAVTGYDVGKKSITPLDITKLINFKRIATGVPGMTSHGLVVTPNGGCVVVEDANDHNYLTLVAKGDTFEFINSNTCQSQQVQTLWKNAKEGDVKGMNVPYPILAAQTWADLNKSTLPKSTYGILQKGPFDWFRANALMSARVAELAQWNALTVTKTLTVLPITPDVLGADQDTTAWAKRLLSNYPTPAGGNLTQVTFKPDEPLPSVSPSPTTSTTTTKATPAPNVTQSKAGKPTDKATGSPSASSPSGPIAGEVKASKVLGTWCVTYEVEQWGRNYTWHAKTSKDTAGILLTDTCDTPTTR